MEILKARNLTIGYKNGDKKTEVISGINLSLCRGELVCLLGANGAGKSTLLRTLACTQPPLSGEVRIDDIVIDKISKSKFAKLLGLVYTDRTSAGALTVRELVELGRQPHTGFLGRLDKHDHEVVDKAINDVGIAYKSNAFVADLSDGERQKAMIAKALAQETPIIFLDEPTAFLDVESKIETIRLLHTLAKENNKAVLLSSHDISQALILADKLWIIDSTGEVESGATEDVILSGRLSTLFASDNIVFDMANGFFRAKSNYQRHVNLECALPNMRHWIINALQRNGIDIDSQLSVPLIQAKAHDNIQLKLDKGDYTLRSVSELVKELARYFNER